MLIKGNLSNSNLISQLSILKVDDDVTKLSKMLNGAVLNYDKLDLRILHYLSVKSDLFSIFQLKHTTICLLFDLVEKEKWQNNVQNFDQHI